MDQLARLEFSLLDDEIRLPMSILLHIICQRLSREEGVRQRRFRSFQLGELLLKKYDLFLLNRMVSIQRFDRLCQFFEEAIDLFLVVPAKGNLEHHLLNIERCNSHSIPHGHLSSSAWPIPSVIARPRFAGT